MRLNPYAHDNCHAILYRVRSESMAALVLKCIISSYCALAFAECRRSCIDPVYHLRNVPHTVPVDFADLRLRFYAVQYRYKPYP
jgi:hypothetical protein